MKLAAIQFVPWDRIYHFDPKEIDLKIGDSVIVKTELGTEVGQVVGFEEIANKKLREDVKPILRKVDLDDLERIKEKEKHRDEVLEISRQLIKKHNLPMKLVDVYFSFDGGRITFAFIAPGRVDFRNIVKDLTHQFQKSIRLHQLGIRDEAKIVGDIGSCGMELCCRRFLRDISSIPSDLVYLQQISHRGSERLVGVCGRLKCCLKYELETYLDLARNLPALGSEIATPQGKGKVVGWHTLKQTVDVDLGDETIVEVPVKIKN